eukprot:snap_masked-scaffold_54-processed-gene-1.49-mRNA-1 protein AED:1.00 eAED:1.00 QI:0/0/0/0/1/1/2/0/161
MAILFSLTDALTTLTFLISNAIKVLKVLQNRVEFESAQTKVSRCTAITGIGLETYLDKNDIQIEGFSLQTALLVIHMSKYLFRVSAIFFCILLLAPIVTESLLFNGDYEDSESVNSCILSLRYSWAPILKLIMFYCLIKGVSGINRKEKRETSVKRFLSSN